jgi:dynein assembly factor 1
MAASDGILQGIERMSQYFALKDRKRLEARQSPPDMSVEHIRLVCVENGGYEMPELNERLFLHYKGFRSIRNLEAYTAVTSLWLDSNALEHIEGLSHMHHLKCLFLGKNLVRKLHGIEELHSLVQLDISCNMIDSLQGLEALSNLQVLNASKNALQHAESIMPLKNCVSLENLDVSSNILDGEETLHALEEMSRLLVLNIAGNPLVSTTPYFRKTMILRMPRLTYLDRAVPVQERLAAEAWKTGGVKAEREVRAKLHQQRSAQDKKNMNAFREWQVRCWFPCQTSR